ncbi:MAG: DegV family protein [Lachnospiraceae bacterium]|nr:DegV family protein [Lachnospiraceae bacterium]
MSKVAIMTDSNSGMTQMHAKEIGITVVPMPFDINGQQYFEDIDLTQEQFYEKLEGDADVKTSQPSPEYLLETWDKLLKEYDEIVYIPMSSGLSGSCSTAKMLAEDYDGKVQVVNNQRISVTMRSSVYDAMELAKQGKSAKEICDILEREKLSSSIYITVDTLKYLKKGGRLTPAVAAIGTLLKIKPVLQIQGDKLDSFAKARNMKAARQIMIDAMKEDFEKRFGGIDKHKVTLCIAYTKDRALAEDFKKEVEPHFPGYDIHIDPLSLSVSCHIGPGALALACSQYVPELDK